MKDATKYYLHPHTYYVPRSPDEVLVRGGHLEGYTLIVTDDTCRGLAAAVIDCLKSPVSAAEVHAAVAQRADVSLKEIDEFLDQIAQSGAIAAVPGDADGTSAWLAFTRFGSLPAELVTRPVTVAGDGLAVRLAQYLETLGLSVERLPLSELDSLERFAADDGPLDGSDDLILPGDAPPGKPFVDQLVVCVKGSRLPELYELNERAIAAKAPVLYLQAAGSEAIIGPYVDPGSSACFWEYEQQRANSFFSYAEYAALTMEPLRPIEISPHVEMSTVVNAASSVLELALTGKSSLAGSFLKIGATTGQMQTGSVLRMPRCPICLSQRPLLRNALV